MAKCPLVGKMKTSPKETKIVVVSSLGSEEIESEANTCSLNFLVSEGRA